MINYLFSDKFLQTYIPNGKTGLKPMSHLSGGVFGKQNNLKTNKENKSCR